jgi:WD40 repeat protein
VKPKLDQIFRSPPLAFSPDGRLLFVAGVGEQVIGWDVVTGAQRFKSPIEPGVADLAVFPDGHTFVTAGPGVSIWATETGERTSILELPPKVTGLSVAVSADGQVVLVGLSNGDIAIYNVADGRLSGTLKGHQAAVTGLAFAPDSKTFASSAGLHDPRLWKIDTELQSAGIAPKLNLKEAPAEAQHGTQVVTMLAWLIGTARGMQLVGAPSLGAAPVFPAAARTNSSYCGPRIAFSPDGRYLAATANLSLLSGEFHLFLVDLANNQTRTITGIYGCSVSFTRDSKMVITGGLGAPVLWGPENGQRVIIRDEGAH